MTPDDEQKFYKLLDEAHSMPHSDSQVCFVEEAVRRADLLGDTEKAYEARQKLTDAAQFSGYPEKTLVAFTWLLSEHDRNAEKYDTAALLWRYKWILGSLPSFPQISLEQIERSTRDMEERFVTYGYNLKPVHKTRLTLALHRGDREAAARHYELWRREPSDAGADCAACERNRLVGYRVFMKEYEQALTEAKPLLAGRLSCEEVPDVTYGHLLYPLFKLGRFEKAAEYHRRGYPKVKNRNYLGTAAQHLTFLVLTDNLVRATRTFEKHFSWALDTKDVNHQFDYFRAGLLLFERLRNRRRKERKLRLPKGFELHREDGNYSVDELHAWLQRQASETAVAFDQRNGTGHFTHMLETVAADAEEVKPFKIRSRKSSRRKSAVGS